MNEMKDERLDDLLDAWRVEPASIRLRDAVLASAPQGRTGRARFAFFEGARLWLAGAGVAAGLAGVSCGVFVSSVALREAQAEALVASATTEASAAISPLAEPSRTL